MPPILNTRTAAVVDPILSTHARGYRNAELVSHLLFPRALIPNRSMRVLRFGKESFRVVNTRRAPGGNTARIQYGYASDPVSLVQDALESTVPREHLEEAASIPGIDLAAAAVATVMDALDLGLELAAAGLSRTAANYDANHKTALVGADRWKSATSTPKEDIDTGKEAIRRYIGRYPNTLLLGPSAYNALSNHPAIVDRYKFTSSASITTAMLAAYFDLTTVEVGRAVYLPEAASDTDAATDVWGDDAILAYVPAAGDNYRVPSYGYTYELIGYPQVENPYYENNPKSWVYPTTVERRPYITGADAGYLIQDAGAAPA